MINEKQQQETLEAAKPLIKWLADNINPHAHIVVTSTSVELMQSIACENTNKFIKD